MVPSLPEHKRAHTHTYMHIPNAQLLETDFKLKEQAEAAIANTKKNFVKKQNDLHEQMKQLEEKVTYRPLFSVPLAITFTARASQPDSKTNVQCVLNLARLPSTWRRRSTIRSP